MAEGRLMPRGTAVLIERDEPERETAGGIALPESRLLPKETGTIRALGDKVKEDSGLAVGGRVAIPAYSRELSATLVNQFFGENKSMVLVQAEEIALLIEPVGE